MYLTPHAYVQLLTTDGGAVARMAITVTDPRFRLRTGPLTFGALDLRLAADAFAASGHTPTGTAPWIGARRFGYLEWFYVGNPGAYQRFALTFNDASIAGDIDVEAVRQAEETALTDAEDEGGWSVDQDARDRARERVRRLCRPNTLVVCAPFLEEALARHEPGGVDLDHVRVLPPPGTDGIHSARRRLLRNMRGRQGVRVRGRLRPAGRR